MGQGQSQQELQQQQFRQTQNNSNSNSNSNNNRQNDLRKSNSRSLGMSKSFFSFGTIAASPAFFSANDLPMPSQSANSVAGGAGTAADPIIPKFDEEKAAQMREEQERREKAARAIKENEREAILSMEKMKELQQLYHKSAVTIQKTFKGFAQRKKYKAKIEIIVREKAIIRIQKVFRGFKEKKHFKQTVRFIIAMQKWIRAYLARKKYAKLYAASKKRRDVLGEILSTEVTYVKKLRQISDVYIIPLTERAKSKDKDVRLIKEEDIKVIFKDLEMILSINAAFLQELETTVKLKRKYQWPVRCEKINTNKYKYIYLDMDMYATSPPPIVLPQSPAAPAFNFSPVQAPLSPSSIHPPQTPTGAVTSGATTIDQSSASTSTSGLLSPTPSGMSLSTSTHSNTNFNNNNNNNNSNSDSNTNHNQNNNSMINMNAKVGKMFIGISRIFNCYSSYINNFNEAMAVLNRTSKDQNFAKFLSDGQDECQGLVLSSLLILPVQRIPRYKLLLEQLLKHTNESHADFVDLTKAASLIDKIAIQINDSKRKAENTQQVLEIQQRIVKGSIEIIAPHRRYLIHVDCWRVKKESLEKKCYIAIFTDTLLYCSCLDKDRDSMSGGKKKKEQLLKYKSYVPLDSVTIRDNSPEDPESMRFVLSSPNISSGASVIFQAESKPIKDAFLAAVKSAQNDYTDTIINREKLRKNEKETQS